MDVRVNNLTSNLHLTDARAMLTPEVMHLIVEEVLRQLQMVEREHRQREQDTSVERRAATLD